MKITVTETRHIQSKEIRFVWVSEFVRLDGVHLYAAGVAKTLEQAMIDAKGDYYERCREIFGDGHLPDTTSC